MESICFQARTHLHLYLFEKREEDITLKIYTVAQKCLYKISLDAAQAGTSLKDLTSVEDLSSDVLKQLIPSNLWSFSSSDKPQLEKIQKALDEVISQFKTVSQTRELLCRAKRELEDHQNESALTTLEEISFKSSEVVSLLINLCILLDEEQKVIAIVTEARETLPDPRSFYRQVLAYKPIHWEFYGALSSLEKTPVEKAHVLLQGALVAMKENNHAKAQEFCTQAEALYPESFIDRCVDLEHLRKQHDASQMKEKILSWLTKYEGKQPDSYTILACKIVVHLEYSSLHCQKIVELYHRLKMKKKALEWFSFFMEKEPATDFLRTGRKSLYTILSEIDAPLSNQKIWNRLGQLYLEHKCLDLAKETYLIVFKIFPTFESACSLAEIFHQQNNVPESVKYYSQAYSFSFLDLEKVAICVEKILQLDPEQVHLNEEMRLQILIQQERLRLAQELKQTQEKLVSFQRVVPSPTAAKSLLGDCPFHEGKTRSETHRLVFIPPDLTLNKLIEIMGNVSLDESILQSLGNSSSSQGYWILMTTESIPNSIGCDKGQQNLLLKEASEKTQLPYQFPTVLEALYFCFSAQEKEKSYFYKRNPYDLTRCQEEIDGEELHVGGFNEQGIHVNKGNYFLGTGAVCRFMNAQPS